MIGCEEHCELVCVCLRGRERLCVFPGGVSVSCVEYS